MVFASSSLHPSSQCPCGIHLPSVLVASYLSFKPLRTLKQSLPRGKEMSLPTKGFSVGSPALISVFLLVLSTAQSDHLEGPLPRPPLFP